MNNYKIHIIYRKCFFHLKIISQIFFLIENVKSKVSIIITFMR